MNQDENGSPIVALSPSRARSLPAMPQMTLEGFDAAFAHASDAQADTASIQKLVLAFKRHRRLVVGFTLAGVVAAFFFTKLQPNLYQAGATIRVNQDESGGSLLGNAVEYSGMPGSKILTEMEVLRSRRLAENAADALHLNVRVTTPQAAQSLVKVISAPRDLPRLTLTLQQTEGRAYRPTVAPSRFASSLPASVQVGVPFTVAGATLLLGGREMRSTPKEIQISYLPFEKGADEVRRDLVVTRPNRDADIINVKFVSRDPGLTEAVPNQILDEFIKYKARTTKTEATSKVAFIREQLASYDQQLKAAESALEGYRENAQIVNIGAEAQASVQRMASLQAERDELQAQRSSLSSVLGRSRAGERSVPRDVAAFPAFIENRGIQDILVSLSTLENERSQLLLRRTPENADVLALTGRIRDLEGQIIQTARAYLIGLDTKLASVNANIGTFGRQIETVPAREIELARLTRKGKLLEDISTLLQTRLKEEEIKEAVQPGDVLIIDRALRPLLPFAPRPPRNLLAGLLLGLLLGLAVAWGVETLDTRVRTRDDVQAVTRGLPVLAAIPSIPISHLERLVGLKPLTNSLAVSSKEGHTLVTLTNSHDLASEAYRALRTNITFANPDRPSKVLVFTSALPGDGKSTTSANLAVSLAEQGTNTLLIDGDLRKGVLHKKFGLEREPGLTEVLLRRKTLNEAIRTVGLSSRSAGAVLDVMTSGALPPNPAELLGSDSMAKLLDELRNRYEIIIIDSPPLNLVTDAALIGTLADSAILVARAGATDKRGLAHAMQQLQHLRVHIAGTVINDYDVTQSGHGYDYGYGYARGYTYAYGGPNEQ